MQEAGMAMFRDFLIKNKRQKYSCLLLLAFSFSAGYNARLLVVLIAILIGIPAVLLGILLILLVLLILGVPVLILILILIVVHFLIFLSEEPVLSFIIAYYLHFPTAYSLPLPEIFYIIALIINNP